MGSTETYGEDWGCELPNGLHPRPHAASCWHADAAARSHAVRTAYHVLSTRNVRAASHDAPTHNAGQFIPATKGAGSERPVRCTGSRQSAPVLVGVSCSLSFVYEDSMPRDPMQFRMMIYLKRCMRSVLYLSMRIAVQSTLKVRFQDGSCY